MITISEHSGRPSWQSEKGSTTKLIILFVLIFIQSNVVPYVIQPKIYSSKIDLSIMWVLFGILTGSTLFGAWGMIIAMPILVTIKISYRVYRQHNPQPNNPHPKNA